MGQSNYDTVRERSGRVRQSDYVTVHVRVSPEQHASLKREAKARSELFGKTSISDIVREAIEDTLTKTT